MSFVDSFRFLILESTRFIAPLAVAIEWVIVILAVLFVAAVPLSSRKLALRLREAFHRLAAHRGLSVLLCGVLPVAIRLSLLGVIPVPEPSIHDEFSHLLMSDTLAHGRLTNRPHPMWQHFESIHIIQQPTYNSMYPPGPGAFLAVGQVVFHEPWAGVLIGAGLMFAAMCWMMQQWLRPAWALFGTLIAILKFGILGFWINSYMGGSVAALGGALLIAPLPWFRRGDYRALHGWSLGAGLAILMNTRPFEGALLGCAAVVYVCPALWREFRLRHRHVLTGAILPAGALLTIGILFTAYYSFKVTGSPARLPYQVNRDTYGWPENLAFLAPNKMELRHPSLQNMYLQEVRNHAKYSDLPTALDNLTTRLFDNWTFFIGPLLTVPLLFLFPILRDRRTRPLVIFLALIIALNLFQLVLYPYHLAPVVPILFAIVAQACRRMYVGLAHASARRGICFVIVLPVCLILVGAMKQNAAELQIPLAYWERAAEPQREARASIEAWLSARPRKQLVIVRYAPFHSPNEEWVYNHARIDQSKVVWAREMDADADLSLLNYFADREAWLLQADVFPPRVVPYMRPGSLEQLCLPPIAAHP